MRTPCADWRSVARTAVAQQRMEAAKYPDDPRLTVSAGELRVQEEDFRTGWAAHHVATLSVGTKFVNHPVAGEPSLEWDTLTASTDPDKQLVVWTAEALSPPATDCTSSPPGPRPPSHVLGPVSRPRPGPPPAQ
ncbi:hypothetical protein ABS735_19245 [Streptomyces sp. MMCC 100]|uniref:MmyB family transcriptional regulator n=1 Tax=Streptomyces sp. MMCC 100 TaxID=3163555 RepID=UPI0035974093